MRKHPSYLTKILLFFWTARDQSQVALGTDIFGQGKPLGNVRFCSTLHWHIFFFGVCTGQKNTTESCYSSLALCALGPFGHGSEGAFNTPIRKRISNFLNWVFSRGISLLHFWALCGSRDWNLYCLHTIRSLIERRKPWHISTRMGSWGPRQRILSLFVVCVAKS